MLIACAGCGRPMERVRKGPSRFWRCDACGAHALTDASLRRLVPADLWAALWPAIRDASSPGRRRCPTCRRAMDETPDLGEGVRLDVCDPCRLLHCDAKELEKIPQVPVTEPEPVDPALARAIAVAQAELIRSEYEAREDRLFGPFRELVVRLVWALIR